MKTKSASDHGRHCSCRLLAQAVGLPAGVIGYHFCAKVLKARWVIECDHGTFNESPRHDTEGKWHDVGEIDPRIKVILVHDE